MGTIYLGYGSDRPARGDGPGVLVADAGPRAHDRRASARTYRTAWERQRRAVRLQCRGVRYTYNHSYTTRYRMGFQIGKSDRTSCSVSVQLTDQPCTSFHTQHRVFPPVFTAKSGQLVRNPQRTVWPRCCRWKRAPTVQPPAVVLAAPARARAALQTESPAAATAARTVPARPRPAHRRRPHLRPSARWAWQLVSGLHRKRHRGGRS
jgi:hypothetical protein